MLTDREPALRAAFLESDRTRILNLPQGDRLRSVAKEIEFSMEAGTGTSARRACADFLSTLAAFYDVEAPGISVLAARPIRTREGGWATELFGDYAPETKVIRVWMRTAVRKQVTSFGTFLSTLCHEFCHHLDYQQFKNGDSWHTRGFYERHRSPLSPCARNAGEAIILEQSTGRALADSLAADEPWALTRRSPRLPLMLDPCSCCFVH